MILKEEIKQLLTHTKGERNAITGLISIIIILIIINQFSYLFKNEQTQDVEAIYKEISNFENQLIPKTEQTYESKLDSFIVQKYKALTLFEFNPNNTTQEEWLRLGLTKKQIKTVLNYTSKGGMFVDKEDFKKMYGIRQKQFEILKPYIKLPEISNQESKYEKEEHNKKNEKTKLFNFDPNTINDQQWELLGMSEKQTAVIRNYINKGGRFKTSSDLEKIYCIKPEKFQELKDYIKIEKQEEKENKPEIKYEQAKEVEINKLTQAEFVELGGFWKYNATKIIEYRQKLGGFIAKEQLLELYGMKPEYYQKIENNIIVNKKNITKININFAEVNEMKDHPYIGYNIAKDIVKYRDAHGPFKNIEQLRNAKIVSQTTFDKLKDYLTF